MTARSIRTYVRIDRAPLQAPAHDRIAGAESADRPTSGRYRQREGSARALPPLQTSSSAFADSLGFAGLTMRMSIGRLESDASLSLNSRIAPCVGPWLAIVPGSGRRPLPGTLRAR